MHSDVSVKAVEVTVHHLLQWKMGSSRSRFTASFRQLLILAPHPKNPNKILFSAFLFPVSSTQVFF